MLSNSLSRSKQPKAVTPRQQELVKQLKRDLERSEKANAKLQERLAQRARYHSPPPGYDGPNPDDIPGPPQFDDQAGSDNEDKREGDYVIDPDHFMPWQEANHANDAVLAGLRREQHLGNRLKHETRWAWQYAIMLPTFLRCRLETSNWGNPRRWNHDFWGPCNCPKKTERDVDLVDVLSRERVKISFCSRCDPSDMVRLLLMGYIGASPVRPQTVFSVRLLVLHHAMWLQCAVPTKGFCEGLDDFLDSFSPLILTSKSLQPRDWREPFTQAVDAYRAILLQIQTLEIQKLKLSDLGVLATNCPKCFGPPVGVTRPEEPDVVICIDGNFQHRRHAAASVEIPGSQPARPDIFLNSSAVNNMARVVNVTKPKDDEVDQCTEAHTTADDTRGKSYFKSMDESGLLGMACRHDHVLKYINLIQSGEKIHYPLAMIKWLLDLLSRNRDHSNKVGILYDIGCNLDKSIKKRELFPEERLANRLKIGTALFHSYAHSWGCQLEYNPRFIAGWGKSNGEGLERVWFKNSKLIKPNRYATKQRRLVSLDLWTSHQNIMQRDRAVSYMVTQTAKYKAELILAQLTLERLVQVDETHTKQYFEAQWNRQQEMQLRAISVRVKEKRERLKVMLQLEENMIEARQKMAELDAIHAPIRTQQQRDDLLNLPTSLANLEIKIQDLAEELGNTQLVNARRGDDAQIKAVLAVQVALAMLYEAKFGVLQQEADAEMRTGAKQQPRNAELRAKKQGLLRKKTATYLRHAAKYNNRFQPAQRLLEPTFEEVLGMDILDPFWNEGALEHPDEPWASCQRTKEGILAFRSERSCEEELRTLGREVRQLMLWGLDYQARVIGAKPNAAEGNNRLVEWESLYSGLAKRTCWLWKRWDHHGVVEVLHSTSQFVEGSDELDVNLRQQWADMVVHTRAQWEVILGAGIYVVEEENNVEDFDEEDFDEYY